MTTLRYYRARLTKGGPYVPIKVWFGPPFVDGEELDRGHRLQALVDTDTTARAVLQVGDDDVPVEIDGFTARNIEPIAEHVYRFMIADAAHAQEWRPGHPKASPREAIDWMKIRPF